MTNKRQRIVGFTIAPASVVLAAAIACGWIRTPPIPFAWVFSLLASAFLALSWAARNRIARIALFNVALLSALLAVTEGIACWIQLRPASPPRPFYEVYFEERTIAPPVPTQSDITPLMQPNDILGAVLHTNVQLWCWVYAGDRFVIRNQIQTTDGTGFRIPPPYHEERAQGSILFFGCSFTFGAYINDQAAMPYRVGLKLQGNYRIHNFGVSSYGPHQMLAQVEYGVVGRCVREPPRHIIYQALPDHAYRASGLRSYSRHSPRYAPGNDGRLVHTGSFAEWDKSHPKPPKGHLWETSFFISKLLQGDEPALHGKHIQTYVNIVQQSRNVLATQYPDARFHILFWDEPTRDARRIERALREAGLEVHRISDILGPDYHGLKGSPRFVSRGHPRPEANAMIADYAASRIIQ